MYGLLVQSEKHGTQSRNAFHGTSNISDQAAVTPLVPNPPRFMLLPITSHKDQPIGAVCLFDYLFTFFMLVQALYVLTLLSFF